MYNFYKNYKKILRIFFGQFFCILSDQNKNILKVL